MREEHLTLFGEKRPISYWAKLAAVPTVKFRRWLKRKKRTRDEIKAYIGKERRT